MNLYVTEIQAIDPRTGEMKRWGGPDVPGLTHAMAEEYCQQNGLGYCKVIGLLVAVVPTLANGVTPDWDNMIDYEKVRLN